jgi:hypothetical protein
MAHDDLYGRLRPFGLSNGACGYCEDGLGVMAHSCWAGHRSAYLSGRHKRFAGQHEAQHTKEVTSEVHCVNL